jgi:hypothetical protein
MLTPIILSIIMAKSAQAEELVPEPTPYIMVQTWATLYDQDVNTLADPAGYGDPEDDFGMKLRRARAGFTGSSDVLKYSVIVGVSSPYDAIISESDTDIQLVDASVSLKPIAGQRLWVTAGTQKVPVSREQIMSSADLVLAERAVPSVWMVPDRDTGVVLSYMVGKKPSRVKLQVGAFNGNRSFLGDNGNGKLIAARAEVMTGHKTSYKTYGVVENMVIGAGGDFFLNKDIATDTMGYGGDVLLRMKGLAVLAELRMGKISPTDSTLAVPGILSETEQFGYLAQVGYTFGEYEAAVRYSAFDDNKSLTNVGDLAAIRAGVTWHGPDDAIRTGLGYEKRLETGADEIDNDSVQLWFQFVN